jgi:hypothetical protein
MSQDVQLYHKCSHLTIEERVLLGDDRRDLQTVQPVASSGLVRILVNDEFFIPQSGFLTPAEISSGISGPFRIVQNENTLTVQTQSETVIITLPIGERVTTDQIVREFKLNASLISAQNLNGHLVFTDIDEVGPDSRITVKGSAAESAGFALQRGARGRQVYPGWRLYQRPDTITNRYPRFNEPVKSNPIFKVTYTAPVERCRRCRATYVENDARFDTSGQVILIENENLLNQAALKIILTDRGSNPYHPWYGTTIRSRIGSKALSSVATVINEDVRAALANLQSIQLEQSKYQDVSFKERLYAILSVQTLQSSEDPTVFLVDVVVQNASSDPVSVSVIFSVPSVVPLLNDTPITPG